MMITSRKGTMFALAILCAMLTGCRSDVDSLVGTYLRNKDGKPIEFIRVEKQGNGYLLFAKRDENWTKPFVVKPVSKRVFAKLLNKPVTFQFEGLHGDSFALLRVPKGWEFKEQEFTCSTGYLLWWREDILELVKK